MELSSKGIHLDVCEDATIASPKWRTLYGMSEVPDVGGTPEKIDVTNLMDANKRTIDGILDFGDLEFKFFYNRELSADTENSGQIFESYTTLRSYEKSGKSVYYRLVYPDGTGHQWKGSTSVKRSGAGVNAALQFTLTTSLASEMQDIKVTEVQK